jgi:NADH-quinone oxidoreductase subunit H
MVTVAALATTLFLGGWRAPWPLSVWSAANTGWWPLLWFLAKVLILLFCFVWLRGTLPRTRYDQLMRLGWKVLIPVALAWILMVATVRVGSQHGYSTPVYIVGGAILAVLLLLAWTVDVAAERRRATNGQQAEEPAGGVAPGAPGPGGLGESAGAGAGFPVPPLDLPHYHGVGVVVPTGESRADQGATPADTVKEVTGA